MAFPRKYKKDSVFLLNRKATWNKFPCRISDKVCNDIIKISGIRYDRKYVRFIISIFFSKMATMIRESDVPITFDFASLGILKTTIFSKISYITYPPIIKTDCKRLTFKFRSTYKRAYIKKMHVNDENVINWLEEKKRNRMIAITISKLKKGIKNVTREGNDII